MLRWCERHGVNYVVGLARNERVVQVCRHYLDRAARSYARSQVKPRRVIVKAEHTGKGSNPRFVVTNLTAAAQGIYDGIYCARGEMENRIKEQQLGLFAERTRCHGWWANQFRLLLSGCAYALMERLRAVGLKGTELARAQVGTIRLLRQPECCPRHADKQRGKGGVSSPREQSALIRRQRPAREKIIAERLRTSWRQKMMKYAG